MLPIHLDVAQDLAEQPRSDVPPFVDGNGCPAAVGVLDLPVTSLGFPQQPKAHASSA